MSNLISGFDIGTRFKILPNKDRTRNDINYDYEYPCIGMVMHNDQERLMFVNEKRDIVFIPITEVKCCDERKFGRSTAADKGGPIGLQGFLGSDQGVSVPGIEGSLPESATGTGTDNATVSKGKSKPKSMEENTDF